MHDRKVNHRSANSAKSCATKCFTFVFSFRLYKKFMIHPRSSKDDQRYGMVEAISHLVHRDYAEIGPKKEDGGIERFVFESKSSCCRQKR